MKFEQLSFGTKVKLVAGMGLLWGGLILLITSNNNFHVITILMGSLLHLDGRISRMEEINESKSDSSN